MDAAAVVVVVFVDPVACPFAAVDHVVVVLLLLSSMLQSRVLVAVDSPSIPLVP